MAEAAALQGLGAVASWQEVVWNKVQAGCVSNGVSGNIKAIYNSPVSHVTPDQYYQYVLICRLPGPAPPPRPGRSAGG